MSWAYHNNTHYSRLLLICSSTLSIVSRWSIGSHSVHLGYKIHQPLRQIQKLSMHDKRVNERLARLLDDGFVFNTFLLLWTLSSEQKMLPQDLSWVHWLSQNVIASLCWWWACTISLPILWWLTSTLWKGCACWRVAQDAVRVAPVC